MRLYISQNDRAMGPYTEEQIRELIYKGEVERAALACREGENDWQPLEPLLRGEAAPSPAASAAPTPTRADTAPAGGVPPPITEPVERLRDPKERTALVWLYIASVPAWLLLVLWGVATFGMVFVIVGMVVLIRFVGELWFRAYIRTNAVRVSPTQLPELCQVVQSCCYRLNMPPPEVYVLQQNLWNAYAVQILGRKMVVLLSGAVDSILLTGNLQQLAWLVGHELGHHRAGHLDFSRRLAHVGGWCIWLELWYSRRAELTCDRMGLWCAGSLRASQLALLNATVGAQLAGKVNAAEAIQQWRQHRGEFFVKYRTLYATHPHHLARLDHLSAAAAELGVAS